MDKMCIYGVAVTRNKVVPTFTKLTGRFVNEYGSDSIANLGLTVFTHSTTPLTSFITM